MRSFTAKRVFLGMGELGDSGHFVTYEGHPLFIHDGGGVENLPRILLQQNQRVRIIPA